VTTRVLHVSDLHFGRNDKPESIAALGKLVDDPSAAQAMGELGRKRQRERFDGEAMVDGYWRALAEVARR